MTLTIEDIRNPSRKSGFDHVGYNVSPGKTAPKPYQGVKYGGTRSKAGMSWIGPRRARNSHAAQDYCDHVNGKQVAHNPSLRSATKAAKPEVTRRVMSEREKCLRAGLRDELSRNPVVPLHSPVCYLVGAQGSTAVKIGHAEYNVYSRVDSLQTGNHRELRLLATLPGGAGTEKKLHAKYIKDNLLNEWFSASLELLEEFDLTPARYIHKLYDGKVTT